MKLTKCSTCKKELYSVKDSWQKKWGYLGFHYHSTHGLPESVVFATMEEIYNLKTAEFLILV